MFKNMSQSRFNKIMNHLTVPFGAYAVACFIRLVLNIFAIIVGLPFAKDSMYVLPLDNIVDSICNGVTWVLLITSIPFFIRGINLLRKSTSRKKRS